MEISKTKSSQKLIIALLVFACLVAAAIVFHADNAYAAYKTVTDEDGFTYTVIVPDKPTSIKAVKTGTNSIKIEWKTDIDWYESKFEVSVYDTSAKKYKHVAYTKNKSYTIKNLKSNTKYGFAVREYLPDMNSNKNFFGKYSDRLYAYTASKKAPKLTSARYVSTGKINVKWKKVSNVHGYILQYSTSKSFYEKNTCTFVVSGSSNNEKALKGLFKRTYYVRVCSYKSANGVKFCSVWSDAKTVNVKNGASLKTAINTVKTDLSGRDKIKDLTKKGVDIKKYNTTYDRMRAIFAWHAKHFQDFAHCVACNSNFAECVNALYGDKRKYDSFIWLACDDFKNNNGTVVTHKWCVLYYSGVKLIFDPRLQGYTGNFDGTMYFGISPSSAVGKSYLFSGWYDCWRGGYKHSDYLIVT